jgi:RNA polymerase sigma-70 factor (ECF subfamily)
MRTDPAAVQPGAETEVRGAHAVARTFAGRARAARVALVNGVPGFVWAPGGKPRVVFDIKMEHEKIVAIDLIADPQRIAALELVIDG